ncbi:MAG TPA: hypothetical protein DCP90_06745 [Clostridiales bacterium]|nr:hypothetical protein [Clostridiales bacterium]
MLITKEVEVKWHYKNRDWYEKKGYIFTKYKDKFNVRVEDLADSSNISVDIKCDGCEKELVGASWLGYKRSVKIDGKYYCHRCSINGYEKFISFEEWCYNNLSVEEVNEILFRWDYELNNCLPSEASFGSGKDYYFKCPRGLHKSELKNIGNFTSGQKGSILCKQCNSFAQWGIDNVSADFLQKYWDYNINIVNPWEIPFQYNKIVFIICQEKDYHGSYPIACCNFIIQCRCPLCNKNSGKVHKYDSLGYLHPKVFIIWSNKNNKSPYEYAPKSNQSVWWKCPDGKHKDYKRKISKSSSFNFRCPDCQYSQGETTINDIFTKKYNWIKISQKDYSLKSIGDIDIFYIPQQKFKGLVGLGNRMLSYDFYIPKYNLLIEYQGQYHDGTVSNQTQKAFLKQVEHDRRKKDYALSNGYNFLEIWYWEFDKIEEILSKCFE